eukprot:scaffold13899_cov153-Amphora_coffeaeformis.AAC.4
MFSDLNYQRYCLFVHIMNHAEQRHSQKASFSAQFMLLPAKFTILVPVQAPSCGNTDFRCILYRSKVTVPRDNTSSSKNNRLSYYDDRCSSEADSMTSRATT